MTDVTDMREMADMTDVSDVADGTDMRSHARSVRRGRRSNGGGGMRLVVDQATFVNPAMPPIGWLGGVEGSFASRHLRRRAAGTVQLAMSESENSTHVVRAALTAVAAFASAEVHAPSVVLT